jgi:chitinase
MMWSAALWALFSATLAACHLAGLQSNVSDNTTISFPAPNVDYTLHNIETHIFGRAETPECGVNSEGQKSCPLNLCCSKSGKCGVDPSFCNDCQKEWGSCAIPLTPKCSAESTSASNGRHVAYYQVADSRRRKCDKKSPSQLNITGITHLNLAFATFDPTTFELRPENQADLAIYSEFTGLKSSTLQTWIAVGGWAFSEPGPTRKTWSKMTSSKENRAKFIASAIDFMDQHGFQGIDLSWEFPSAADRGGDSSHDAANMVSSSLLFQLSPH